MQTSSNLSVFHFLFCELIQQCYSIYKQQHYIENLKRIGKQIGFKMFNQISLKRSISQRPQNLLQLIKSIQQKVFKHILGYQANSFYSAYDEQTKENCFVIVDQLSVYFAWMPDNLWDTASFFAGFIESIMECSGVKCSVSSTTKNQQSDKIATQYLIRIPQKQYQKWKQQ